MSINPMQMGVNPLLLNQSNQALAFPSMQNTFSTFAQPLAGVGATTTAFNTSPMAMVANILAQLSQMINQSLQGIPTGNQGFSPPVVQRPSIDINSLLAGLQGLRPPTQPVFPQQPVVQQPIQQPIQQPTAPVGSTLPPNMRPVSNDFRTLSTAAREQVTGLSAPEIGSLHYFGRGVAMNGRLGGYQAMWQAMDLAEQGRLNELTPRDRSFVETMIAQGQATGQDPAFLAEQAFLSTTDKISGGGSTFRQIAGNQPPLQDNGTRLNIGDLANQLNPDKIIFSTWFHEMLDNGEVDGSSWFHELASGPIALMGDAQSQATLQAVARYEAADGNIANNSFNRDHFANLFSHIYSGQANQQPMFSVNGLNALANQQATRNGRSMAQVDGMVNTTINNFRQAGSQLVRGVGQGIAAGVGGSADLAGNATAMGNAALSAICPFFSAGVGGLAASQNAPPANHQATV
jgi:hypothetical protein